MDLGQKTKNYSLMCLSRFQDQFKLYYMIHINLRWLSEHISRKHIIRIQHCSGRRSARSFMYFNGTCRLHGYRVNLFARQMNSVLYTKLSPQSTEVLFHVGKAESYRLRAVSNTENTGKGLAKLELSIHAHI